MSVINPVVSEKIRNLRISPDGLLEFYENIAADAEVQNLPASTLVIPLFEEGDLSPDEWAPELHLVVRKVAEN